MASERQNDYQHPNETVSPALVIVGSAGTAHGGFAYDMSNLLQRYSHWLYRATGPYHSILYQDVEISIVAYYSVCGTVDRRINKRLRVKCDLNMNTRSNTSPHPQHKTKYRMPCLA